MIDRPAPDPTAPHGHRETSGEQVGAYTLLAIVGQGGAGTVWRARRCEPFEQIVALKILKPGMDSEAVIARFDQERQALARLDHPAIARAIDGGLTPRGRPYFVMEFVDGLPITTACDARSIGLRQRAELHAQACDAVQHAHPRGFLHRDLTPGNVLVRQDEHGQRLAKVIDFGLARAVGAAGRLTPTGVAHRMGTPDYMAPEQWDGGLAACDARADVFALGIMLGELMAGCVPRPEHAHSTGSSASKQARPRPAPMKPIPPSTAFDALALRDGAKAREIAKRRSTTQRDLRSALERLDPLVATLTAGEPASRPVDATAVLDLL